MSGGHGALEAFIAKVEKIRELNEEVAKKSEKDVADVVRASASAGESPSGDKWPARKEGGKALRGAAAAITSSTKGNRIILKIGPPDVFHNYGAGGSSTTKHAERSRKAAAKKSAESGTKSKFHAPQRQIIPSKGEATPAAMTDAIEDVAKDVFGKAMGR